MTVESAETVPLLGRGSSDKLGGTSSYRKGREEKSSIVGIEWSLLLTVADVILSILMLVIVLRYSSENELKNFLRFRDVPQFTHYALTVNIASIMAIIDVCGPLLLRLFGLFCQFKGRTATARDCMSCSFLYLVMRLYTSLFDPAIFQLALIHQIYLILWAVLSGVHATIFKDSIIIDSPGMQKMSSCETLRTVKSDFSVDSTRPRSKSNESETSSSDPSSSNEDGTKRENMIDTGDKEEYYGSFLPPSSSPTNSETTSPEKDFSVSDSTSKSPRLYTKPRLLGLEALRFFGVLHIIVISFYRYSETKSDDGDKDVWDIFAEWGNGEVVLFFMLSGFVLSYVYSEKCHSMCTYAFWSRRFARLYPSYLLSIIAMCVLLPPVKVQVNVLIVMLFGVQAWVPFAYNNNPINVTGWCIGVFVFLSLLFPAMCRIISGTPTTKELLLMLCWFWPLAVLGATVDMGIEIGQALMPIYELIFRAHIAEFLFGITLGCIFVLNPIDKVINTRVGYISSKIATSLAVVALNVVYMTVDVNGHGSYFSYIGVYGLMIPVYAVLIWFTATDQDLILSGVFSSRVVRYLGSIAFQTFIFSTVANEIAIRIGYGELTVGIAIVLGGVTKLMESDLATAFIMFYEAPFRTSLFQSWLSWMKSGNIYDKPVWLKATFYYIAMLGFIGGYSLVNGFRLYGSQAFINLEQYQIACTILNSVRWTALLGGLAAVLTFIGQFLYCPWIRDNVPTIPDLLPLFKNRMFFRIVTRGSHPLLVRQNALDALNVLKSCLPASVFVVEVVTDNGMNIDEFLEENMMPPEFQFVEIVVPKSFRCASGAKYKARALHYAILNSEAKEADWIVHLDEETRFDADTVKHVLAHCVSNDIMLGQGNKRFADIGQGVILYGANTHIDNYMTTLADSFRVGDDFGKFRLQYKSKRPWIGMHGSFVVCPNAVEKEVGFDHGMPGSITEDAYFALVAWSKDVKFSWVDAYMYEQSPFSIYDFIMQRRRWFGGLWLVCWEKKIGWQYRLTLLFMITTWAFGSVPMLVTATSWVVSVKFSQVCTWLIACMSATYAWSYALGFIRTFNIYDGIVRYFILLSLQLLLLPIYAGMEVCGVSYAVINPPFDTFHVVMKEGKAVSTKESTKESAAS
mmetsp:Transcript_20533/g.20646  ORF Transcript_20533/g.20646 Transcript_20533/m.20646 type:complete len:1137 (+) Transcript_20533:93-3503(+)|eukprot:CAMPEP_0182424584 /NCGR_PEP_ID=MMETSP1167-20130531/10788_1 /TAXON_ID=2988 /ORGANISM="Mallomonas Sp, Strain CCMP3275" /LENGTH=1136 /DNA_ID=CAMNT_0024604485 /DNA_START=91 /DNA_END=3501 /DNA_ORIENTATION=+